jgi:hypothetical protein
MGFSRPSDKIDQNREVWGNFRGITKGKIETRKKREKILASFGGGC